MLFILNGAIHEVETRYRKKDRRKTKLNCTQSLLVSAVCPTGDLWVYHKNAIIVPMRALKFGSFTDINSVVLF